MTILIKGMEMPENCVKCRFLYGTTTYDDETDRELFVYECFVTGQRRSERDFTQSRFELCPLIEIPPHGRLIDADEFFEKIPPGDIEHDEKISRTGAIADVCTWVLSAPTVIEAEKEG